MGIITISMVFPANLILKESDRTSAKKDIKSDGLVKNKEIIKY